MGTTRLRAGPSWPIPVSPPKPPSSYRRFNWNNTPIPVLRCVGWFLSYGDWVPYGDWTPYWDWVPYGVPYGDCRHGWYRNTFGISTHPIVRGPYLPVGCGPRDPIQDEKADVQSPRPLWWTSYSSVLSNNDIRRPHWRAHWRAHWRPNRWLRDRL